MGQLAARTFMMKSSSREWAQPSRSWDMKYVPAMDVHFLLVVIPLAHVLHFLAITAFSFRKGGVNVVEQQISAIHSPRKKKNRGFLIVTTNLANGN